MKVDKSPGKYEADSRMIFQVISYNEEMNKEYGSIQSLFEKLEKGEVSFNYNWPSGLDYLECLESGEKAGKLIEARYYNSKTTEAAIVNFLEKIGIKVKTDIDQDVMEIFKKAELQRSKFHNFMEGINDDIPEGINRDALEFFKAVNMDFEKNYKSKIIDFFKKEIDSPDKPLLHRNSRSTTKNEAGIPARSKRRRES
ncbi:MAG: hypothetical protein Q8L11_00020 [Candidatus Moranbacteria bacterium]|nr:hypothetical protein [Candidatus Moranbacteria bacterium]